MRILALLAILSLAAVHAVPLLLSIPVSAQGTRLEVTIGVDPRGETFFFPDTILIPQLNITLNVTFRNNYSNPGQVHTFTIVDAVEEEAVINTGDLPVNGSASVEFHIFSMNNISYNGSFFEPQASGTGIRFFCVPHNPAMQGRIVLASEQAPEAEKGVLLRAYWIGIIGIAATLGWVGVIYFVIKSSSRHFTDHREHIRRGLP
jgi:hypothetical protein